MLKGFQVIVFTRQVSAADAAADADADADADRCLNHSSPSRFAGLQLKMAAHARKKSEKIQNIFPEHLELFWIFWKENNYFLKNTFFRPKSKMAASRKKPVRNDNKYFFCTEDIYLEFLQ